MTYRPKHVTVSYPDIDPHIDQVDQPAFKEAQALAMQFDLAYLSISGVHKLSLLIREVRSNRPTFQFLNEPLFVVKETDMANLLIVSCSNPLLWYAAHLGAMVPLLRDLPAEQCWLVREPSGYSNVLRYQDGVTVPEGYQPTDQHLLIEPNDLLLKDRKWLAADVDLWGRPTTNLLVIRRACANT